MEFYIPPEIIGTGRGIKYVRKIGKELLLEKYYINIKKELNRAGGFLCKEVLMKLAKQSKIWQGVVDDVPQIENYLGEKLGPVTQDEIEHAKIVKKLYQKLESGESYAEYLQILAVLRKSIG